MTEQQLIPYQAVREIPARSVLVLAPHPDDEVFGCGGTLARHAAAGIPVHVVVATDGGFCAEAADRSTLVATREAESRAAAAVLGVPAPEFWRIPDRTLRYGEALVDRVVAAIRARDADLVFAPSPCEAHPDHSALAMAAIEAVRRIGAGLHLALYEIGVPLHPNTLVDISDLLEKKRAAMRCFVSQLAHQRYDEQIEALNRYRAYTLPFEVIAAEAFEVLAAEDVAHNHLGVFASDYHRRLTRGVATIGTADLPLVSIIIRSMDRSYLNEALDSISLQTYPNIEVIVVHACGSNHRDVGEYCGPFPLREVRSATPLMRSKAANAGLNVARGKFIGFLDDDDFLLADHVTKLVRALVDSPAKAAYSDVRATTHSHEKLFDEPWSFLHLLGGNFIPLNAVLFSHDLLSAGCRFDETLDCLEDWDFWLQLAHHTLFIHVSGVSAVYRMQLGNSGLSANFIETAHNANRARIYAKWRTTIADSRWGEAFFWFLQQRDYFREQLQHKQEELNTVQESMVLAKNQLAALEAQIHAAEANAASMRQQLEQVINSRSWRITMPLRKLARIFR